MAERTVSVGLRVAGLSAWNAGWQQAGKAVDNVDRSLTKAVNAIGKNRAAMNDLSNNLGIVGAAMTGLGVLAVKRFADFEKAMSSVKATGDDARLSFDQLREAALQAGADTAFSATEAAGAVEELAKAGVSSRDILAGGLRGALDLAAAGQLDVAQSAGIAATAMTQFGLAGKDIPHIADLLAAAAGKAQGEVSDMGLALKYVGPIAAQMGISIEETAGAIALLASNGILGDQAGTSLRGMLSSLTSPSAKAADKMKELGISVYDAQGNFIGFEGVAGQLQSSMGDLDNATRDAALGVLFGNEQLTAARILYKGGAADVRDWTNQVNDSGYAVDAAATKMDNLSGDFEQLMGSVETAMIGMGDTDGVLRGVVQGATGVVNAFNALPGPIKQVSLLLVGGGGLVLLGIAGLTKLTTSILDTRSSLMDLGISGRRVSGMLKFAGVVGTVYAIGTAVDALSDKLSGVNVDVTRLSNDLAEWAGHGKTVGEVAKLMGGPLRNIVGDFNNLDFALDNLVKNDAVDYINNFTDAVFPWSGAVDDSRKQIEQLDSALASLAAGGNAKEAAAAFDVIAERARQQGVSVEQLRDLFPQYTGALRNSAAANKDAGGAIKDTGDAAGEQAPQLSAAAQALKDMEARASELKTSLDLLNTTMGLLDAESAYEAAIDDITTRLEDYKKEVADGAEGTKGMKGALDLGTQAGRDNAEALRTLWKRASDYSIEALEVEGNQKKANRILGEGRAQLVDMAAKFLGSRTQAEKYVTEVLGIPKDVSTKYTAPGLSANANRAAGYKATADNLDGRTVTTTFSSYRYNYVEKRERTLPWFGGQPAAGGLVGRYSPIIPMQGGGHVTGRGGPMDDAAGLFALSNGEFVMRARAVDHWGVEMLDALNRLDVGAVQGFAPAPPSFTAQAGGRSGSPSSQVPHVQNNTFNMRTIDLDQRTFQHTQRVAALRERIGKPS